MSKRKPRVLFLGAGRMAQAIIEGLVKKDEFDILVANSGNKERLTYVQDTYGVQTAEKWEQEVRDQDIILLAMPPEVHEPLLKKLAPMVQGQLVITVAAGITPTYLEENLPSGTPTAWIMPNTAAKIGKSMTLYAVGKHVGASQLNWIEALISGIGEFERVSEEQVVQLTAVTGSAPAFIYRIAEALETIVLGTGVTKEQAKKLVAEMIAGSAEMLKSPASPRELAEEVATPGGSTAAGLDVLDHHQLGNLMTEAIEACRKKVRGE